MRRLVVVMVVMGMLSLGCVETDLNSDAIQARQTEMALGEAQRQIGMPNVVNYQQRKLMKMIYELCDKEDLICYAYIKSDYHGKLVFIGKCVGFGIPFSAQFTNPERVVEGDKQIGYDLAGIGSFLMTLPQADPNGLFMPTSSSATWLMMIDPETNDVRPVYLEPEIVVSPFPLTRE
jgi:hypothetical protein